MINRIIQWSLDNRFLVILLTILLVVLGGYAVTHTPVDAIPDLSDVQVIVKTSYPGQAPQVVENQVTYPLATAMLAVPEAQTVRAYSFYGDSYIYVIFKDGTDPYWARSRVLEYLQQALPLLPKDVKPQLGPDATGVGWVYQYALVDETGQHDISQLTTLQNWFLKYELQTVPGVAEVATVGGMVKQYQVTLDPNRVRAYGFTLPQIKEAIQKANEELGGSVVEMAEAEYMVRTKGYLSQVGQIKEIPLGVNNKGTPILLSDVARISIGPQMREGVAELDGRGEVVGGIVVMRQGQNALQTIDGVKAKLQQLQKSLPSGVRIVETYNRSQLIHNAINTLNQRIIEECLVVILVCFIFLWHFRSAFIVVLSLPIGILTAFIVMYWQGINANILSLGGIAVAIGAMVDAAIVMIENVHQHFERENVTDENRWQVIANATKEVGKPLFFSLLIITLSFLPIFALQAQEGRMFKPLAFTKTYAMAAAAGLSITLVPVLLGFFIRHKVSSTQVVMLNRWLQNSYRPVLDWVLMKPKTVLFGVLLLVLVSYWPFSHLGSEFMPELNEGDLMYMPSTLPGISIGKARQLLQQTDRLIKTIPEVKSVFGKIGRAETATDPASLTMIESVIQLKPRSEWRAGMTLEKIKEQLHDVVNFPGLTDVWVMPIQTRIDMLATGIKTPVGIKITGPSLSEIRKLGQQLEQIVKQVPGTASVYADRDDGGRYINVDINRRAAARYGLTIDDIQTVISTAVGGSNVTQTIEGRERFPINVRYPQHYRDDPDAIKFLPIVTSTGAHIPLADVANIYISGGPPMIKSENARLTGWVLIDIADVDLGHYVKQAQKLVAEQLKLPAGYTLSWSGKYEYMQRAEERLAYVLPLTFVIILLLLYFNFRRFPDVLMIITTLPLAAIGGVWLMYFAGYHLSVAVAIGFIALCGVAVEIGVVMLMYLNQALQRHLDNKTKLEAEEIKQAVIEGALLRLRPVVMTVVATTGGLLPIMLGGGTGSEVMRRIAAPMVGGMISAMVLALLVIPAVFYLWQCYRYRVSPEQTKSS